VKAVNQDSLLDQYDAIRAEPCSHTEPGSKTPCWDCTDVRTEAWAERAAAYLEKLDKFYGRIILYV